MKKILYLSAIALSLLSVSCQEENLITTPTSFIGNPSVDAKLNGLYVLMITPFSGGTGVSHEDFGHKGYDIYSDMMSQDMVLEGLSYSWYSNLANMSAQTDFTRDENYAPWRFYYKLVAASNDVIDDLGGTDHVPSVDVERYTMGQAKAMRAYAYFYLLQFYTKGYNAGESAIPIYVKSQSPAAPKSTQKEVYDLIIKDLTTAIDYLDGFNRPNKGFVDQSVAKGMLAYVYAAIGQNAEAALLSKEIINNYGYPVTSPLQAVRMVHQEGSPESGGGFNDLETPSWMWGFDLDVVNELNLISWWGQIDVFTYSYASSGAVKGMDLGLYDSMRPDDIRRNQFIMDPPEQNYPGNKFFDPNRIWDGQLQITTDYIYMRADEFHLLAAECLAKLGQDGEAKSILKNYIKNRIEDVSYIDQLSGSALQKEIYKNTRLEFWGEGKSYLALKRNKATATKGKNHLFLEGESFSYDDERMYLKIPQQEILNNPNF